MTTASYLLTDPVQARGAALYDGPGRPLPYWHLALRPSGGMNASVRDMTRFVRMLINRGELGGSRIVSAAAGTE
jgi:CubicO group peptidase (beta-lactamase class C family)